MKKLGLDKKEKLCSARAIEDLFGPGGASFTRLCYPLRAVARNNPRRRSDAPVAFVISVPKKRLHRAVDRVLMRRRIREAYRLCHQDFPLIPGLRIDIAFVYVANDKLPYDKVDAAVHRIMAALAEHFNSPSLGNEIPS